MTTGLLIYSKPTRLSQ